MRPLEIAVWSVTAAVVLWCLSHREAPAWGRALAVLVAPVMVAHLLIEGPRWHLYPAYAVALYSVAIGVWPRALEPNMWAALTGSGLLVATAALATAFPVFRLPHPTGPRPIGTVTLHLVDRSRRDPNTDRADGRRELMVQLWYPAETGGAGQPYRTRAEAARKTDHLTRVSTHAVAGAPVARAPAGHPVVLFSPSAGGRRNHNTVHAEELASHGFVVVGIDHPYDTDLVAFPDGRVARAASGAVEPPATAEERLRVRVADARFVLDEVERLGRSDPNGPFAGRLAPVPAGIFGHSFGGAVAAEVCLTDSRFAAGVNFDGSIYGEAVGRGFGKPFLFFAEDVPVPTPDEIAAAPEAARRELQAVADDYGTIRRALAVRRGLWITIRGARHVDFCDSPMYSPLWRLSRSGSIRHERVLEITSTCLLAFFRTHLMGAAGEALEDVIRAYPEVAVERPACDAPTVQTPAPVRGRR